MAKISMLIPDEQLAVIDAQAGGNRTAFMIAAALERAKRLRRQRMDDEIAASVRASDADDSVVYDQWEATIGDGLE
jgi:homoserine kinase